MPFHSFTCSCPVFPALFTEEAVFASIVKNKVPIGAWVYFWTFCQYHTVLMMVALWYNLKSGRLISPAPFFFLKTALTIRGLLCFNMDVRVGL